MEGQVFKEEKIHIPMPELREGMIVTTDSGKEYIVVYTDYNLHYVRAEVIDLVSLTNYIYEREITDEFPSTIHGEEIVKLSYFEYDEDSDKSEYISQALRRGQCMPTYGTLTEIWRDEEYYKSDLYDQGMTQAYRDRVQREAYAEKEKEVVKKLSNNLDMTTILGEDTLKNALGGMAVTLKHLSENLAEIENVINLAELDKKNLTKFGKYGIMRKVGEDND